VLFAITSSVLLTAALGAAPAPQPIARGEEVLVTTNAVGKYGGQIVVALKAEPKTLNPVTAIDVPSREVIGRMIADLLHINAVSEQSQPALAKSWKVSKDGLHYVLTLRRGVRFSDGIPLDADDVVFTFQVLLDEKIGSPQRDLLLIDGKPIAVRKVDAQTITFDLPRPYAAAERLFDSMAILPRHLLEKTYREGTLAQAWGVTTPPAEIAGLGPFRLKEYVAGQRLVLERNPYYWKADKTHHRLPYLDQLVFMFVPSEDSQVLRFEAGETDIISRVSADNYAALEKNASNRKYQLVDLGPALEYNFVFFNLNSKIPEAATDVRHHQQWFRNVNFRQAVSAAIDRAALVRLVYHGRATPLWGTVTPANKLWLDTALPETPRSVERAKQLLAAGGFRWDSAGRMIDSTGAPVEFSLISSASNAQRMQMATLIQDDLKQIGINLHVVPMEFKSVVDRVFNTHDYDAVILALGGGDVDPNSQINMWMSNGSSHLWDLGEPRPATKWESEIDQLMSQQLTSLNAKRRKQLYDRVQEIASQELPLICLVSPNVLVGAKDDIGNFQPAILDNYTLWNVDELYIK
jgi:peptide/nickel transport system substrate-binding protein